MTDDEIDREPEYDPESVGFPDTIDPDSSAYDEDESVREADGPTTPLAPYYTPAGLDEHDDSQLDQRLRAEVPDVSADDPEPDPRRVDAADDEWEADEDPEDDEDPQDGVGRLGDDNYGGQHTAYAMDEGLSGGGASAEEAAMHLTGGEADEDEDEDEDEDNE